MKIKILKGITLILFSTLIIGFVIFRSGYFGGQKSTFSISPNGGALNNQSDTLPKVDSLKKIEMMSSSKVLILREHKIYTLDTTQLKIDTLVKFKPVKNSLKSGVLLKPADLIKKETDTNVTDSLKRK